VAVSVLERIAQLPSANLAVVPTPLLPMHRLSSHVGLEVWIKRDDMTGLGSGGNKARKLNFLAGQAMAEGADVLVTGGGPGSNHAQLTAAAAARLGLDCVLVIYGSAPSSEPVNLTLARRMGAEVVFTNNLDRTSVDHRMVNVCGALDSQGRRAYCIPRGGANAIGCVGYVEAAFELQEQLVQNDLKPSHVFLATGSCGTHAGLLLGSVLAGSGYTVIGVTVSRPLPECADRIRNLISACAQVLAIDDSFSQVDVSLIDNIGPAYGQASPAGEQAALLAARAEGLLLDPVYTAKAFAAMLDEVKSGRVSGPAIFLHTGGAGGLIPGGEARHSSPRRR
jgi:D-cysteine desulfhydrase